MAIYQLRNDWIAIEVLSKGAELKSLVKREDGTNYLWSGDPAAWGKTSPNLFPAIGNVKGFSFNRIDYKMTKHGFVRDMEFEVTEQESNRLELTVTDNEYTRSIFPFRFRFSVAYELADNKLLVTYIVNNLDDKNMFYQIGGHPAFSTELDGTELADYYLAFDEPTDLTAYRVDLESGWLNPEPISVAKGVQVWQFNKPLFDEDAFVFRNIGTQVVTLKNQKNNRSVRFRYEDFSTLAVWSMKDKGNFVCLEPWNSIPDLANGDGVIAHKEDAEILGSGKGTHYEYSITII